MREGLLFCDRQHLTLILDNSHVANHPTLLVLKKYRSYVIGQLLEMHPPDLAVHGISFRSQVAKGAFSRMYQPFSAHLEQKVKGETLQLYIVNSLVLKYTVNCNVPRELKRVVPHYLIGRLRSLCIIVATCSTV